MSLHGLNVSAVRWFSRLNRRRDSRTQADLSDLHSVTTEQNGCLSGVSGVKLYFLYCVPTTVAAGDSDELTPLPTTFLVYGSDMNSASNWLIIRSDRMLKRRA